MWKIVNENCNFSKKSYSDLPDIYFNETKDTKISDPLKKVICFNEYFVKIPQHIHASLKNQNFSNNDENNLLNTKNNVQSLLFMPIITEQEVLNIFKTLTDSTAYDHDFLSPKLIKNFKNELSKPLCVVINTCIQAGHFPDDLKISCMSKLQSLILISHFIDRNFYML